MSFGEGSDSKTRSGVKSQAFSQTDTQRISRIRKILGETPNLAKLEPSVLIRVFCRRNEELAEDVLKVFATTSKRLKVNYWNVFGPVALFEAEKMWKAGALPKDSEIQIPMGYWIHCRKAFAEGESGPAVITKTLPVENLEPGLESESLDAELAKASFDDVEPVQVSIEDTILGMVDEADEAAPTSSASSASSQKSSGSLSSPFLKPHVLQVPLPQKPGSQEWKIWAFALLLLVTVGAMFFYFLEMS